MSNRTGPLAEALSGGFTDNGYGFFIPPGMKQIDGAPSDVVKMSHYHWHNFPPSNPAWNYLFAMIYLVLWAFSAVGNGLVIYIFTKTKNLRSPANMLIVNLAVADFFMMMTQAPMFIISAFSSRWWIWGHHWCRIYAYLGSITGIAAIFTMVWIGFDRYNVIVKGMGGTKITKGMAFGMIAWTWVYANIFSLPPLLQIWSDYNAEGLLSTCSFDYLTETPSNKQFVVFMFTGAYVFPLTLLIFFYSHIVKAVWAHEAALKQQAKKMNVTSLRSNVDANAETAEMRIAKIALSNVLLWVCIWTPYGMICMMGAFGDRSFLTPLVAQLPALTAKCASVLNPLVYAISHPKYRQALQKQLPWFCIHEPEDKRTSDNQSTTDSIRTTET